MQQDDAKYKAKELEQKGTGSYGYGGKFGVQQDRMDKVSFLSISSEIINDVDDL